MVKYIDTHAHLYAEEFNEDLNEVVSRATESGVGTILLPNIEQDTTDAMKRIVEQYPNVFIPMMGLHPCSVKPDSYIAELEHVSTELSNGNYIAVGEIGMDLYWDKSTKDIQEEAFRTQCALAIEHDLPIAIHSRDSTDELIEILQDINSQDITGVFHCFTGTEEQAEKVIDLGFKLGIGGVVTFKNAGLDKTLANIDLGHLILETDSPYLAPTPHRGKRNESSYIPLIAQKIAEVKGVSIEKVADITSLNAVQLFKLKNLPL